MEFVKYSASGNDFLITRSFARDDGSRSALARLVCARHSGIGADGMVVLLESSGTHKGQPYAYEWEFYNADGSHAAMCGNASRSIGHYAYTLGIAPREHSFLSAAGVIGICVDSTTPCLVQSDLGAYKIVQKGIIESLSPEMAAYACDQDSKAHQGLDVAPQAESKQADCWDLIDTGVPHLVGFVSGELPRARAEWMRQLRTRFNANINLARIEQGQIAYMTYERGVEDITQACGTGAAAVFALALERGLCGSRATLIPPSGERLNLSLSEKGHILFQGLVSPIARCEWLQSLRKGVVC